MTQNPSTQSVSPELTKQVLTGFGISETAYAINWVRSLMKPLILVALTAVFTFCSAAETEESFSDLEGSAASKEFTPAERKHFTKALDRFNKYELKKYLN
jgi:hypothetical protein